MPRLGFDLPASAIARGVRERSEADAAAAALVQLRGGLLRNAHGPTAGLLGGGAPPPGLTPPTSRAPTPPNAGGPQLSLRFAAAAAAPSQQPTQARPRDAITFATLLGPNNKLPPAPPAPPAPPVRPVRPAPPVRPVPPPVATGIAESSLGGPSTALGPCDNADQYAVYGEDGSEAEGGCARCWEVAHGVLCSNAMSEHPTQRGKRTSPVLGPTGHLERFSAWSHWIGAAAFAVYAALRPALLESESTAGQLATAAAITVVFTLASSGLYHSTAPDAGLSTWSRFLDYAAIYIGLVVTSVADIAVSTRGFLNVPVETVIDIPIAGTVMLLFFLWRRWLTDPKESWGDDARRANTECSIGMGLFRRQHFDLHHTQLRYATSFLLSIGYFAWVPAAFLSFDAPQAGLIVGLQAAGFATLSLGMFIDRVLEWPDAPLVRGDAMAMRCKPCGCVANAHGIWHIVAIVSILLTTAAREYGLAIS